MAGLKPPRQWALTKTETITSFMAWKDNLSYHLAQDATFATFMGENFTWGKKNVLNRGLQGDAEGENRLTAAQKVVRLNLMLGQIANYCPIISRSLLIDNSTSLESVWQTIRLHFGFQSSGGHFLDLASIKLEPQERPEDLYQRLRSFFDDNLLKAGTQMTHHGDRVQHSEELSPSLENTLVFLWLQLVHKDLPTIVKQRYGTELRHKTLASIKPEISLALDSLLEEIKTGEDARVMRSAVAHLPTHSSQRPQAPRSYTRNPPHRPGASNTRSCPICKAEGRRYDHFLSACKFLPESDRKYMTRARAIAEILEQESPSYDYQESTPQEDETEHTVCRVQVIPSPFMHVYYHDHPIKLTLDTGATSSMVKLSVIKRIGAPIQKPTQIAKQADGKTSLNVVGEISIPVTRDSHTFMLNALVVENLDVDVLAGNPFLENHYVTIDVAHKQIGIGTDDVIHYGTSGLSTTATARRATIVRAPNRSTVVWPGEAVKVDLPDDVPSDSCVVIEPRWDSKSTTPAWLHPTTVQAVGRQITLANDSPDPQLVRKNDHLCQVTQLVDTSPTTANAPVSNTSPRVLSASSEAQVSIDPDRQLPENIRNMFVQSIKDHAVVFKDDLPGYNGAYGKIHATVNMGKVLPPQRKGKVPQYSRDRLTELQNKFDELENLGVFQKPEDIDTTIEYLNPSFLVRKPSGAFRLVTAFGDIGRYAKPQPSLMPDIDSVLRTIGSWRFLISTDLSKAFYQIPLDNASKKYCGVATPFKGIRTYARCAMGMPGSETALEELMSRIFGDLVQKGCIAKIADDLFCGGNTHEELLQNWIEVLKRMQNANLRLSAHKTIIAPARSSILGWDWADGTITAKEHRIAVLASCSRPSTVKGLRGFIGAFKVLARVIPNCSSYLRELESAVAGASSADKVAWSDSLCTSFQNAQSALSKTHTITIPRPDDQLWISTDASISNQGIAATLFITRNETTRVGGYFSAKLKQHHVRWLPCELEALAIALAIKHFTPYIIQSSKRVCILTDSKPCVEAYEKLARGHFSASPRVATFLTVASRYQVQIQHLAGTSNLPSDFASRNPTECYEPSCQICSFIAELENSAVRATTVSDILSGTAKLPYTTRSAWLATQRECPDLRRVHAHLSQGTRPSRKLTNINDIKRYLQHVTISKDGLLVAQKTDPLKPTREAIVIPRQALEGLLTALHIQLGHPSKNQMKKVFSRFFYALDADKAVDNTCDLCHQCTSLKTLPSEVHKQTSDPQPEAIGTTFAADIIKRAKQVILLVRESISSYTMATIIDNEQHQTIRDTLIQTLVGLVPLDGPPAVVRVDPAPGFVALANDEFLLKHRIRLEFGRTKNPNKNPVAEHAIRELEQELLHIQPGGAPVSKTDLAIAVATLNSRLRSSGVSAREFWCQRDQFTMSQIPIDDQTEIRDKQNRRNKNHTVSEKSKSPSCRYPVDVPVNVGDLVYIKSDLHKNQARPRYLVSSSADGWCYVRKFTGQQLRAGTYKVRPTDCIRVRSQVPPVHALPPTPTGEDRQLLEQEEEAPITVHKDLPQILTPPLPITQPPNSGWDDSPIALLQEPEPEFSGNASSCPSTDDSSIPTKRQSTRTRRMPDYLKDYIVQ